MSNGAVREMHSDNLKGGNAYDLGDINKENISGARKAAVLH